MVTPGDLAWRGGRPVQARFSVPNGLPLFGATLVAVMGYAGNDPSDSYGGYGTVDPNGQIRIEGTKPGWRYTVSVSAQIPVAIPAS